MTTKSGPASMTLLIGVETDELVVFGHVDAVLERVRQVVVRAVESIAEGVGHRNQFHGALRAERLAARAGAAAAATDQADLDRLIAGGVGRAGDAQRAGQRGRRHRR